MVRSRWPNLDEGRFVALARAWAGEHGVEAVLVFDGSTPEAAADETTRVVGTGRGSADDWIAAEAGRIAASGRRFWLVTSDRGLRARVAADRVIGGGSFAGELERMARAS